LVPKVASPKQTSPKAAVAALPSPKTPTSTSPQQTSPKVQTLTEPTQAKTDTKKVSRTEGEQQSAKVTKPCKGKGPSKPKGKLHEEAEPLTMEQNVRRRTDGSQLGVTHPGTASTTALAR